MRRAERRAHEAIADVPCARALLDAAPSTEEKTRAGYVGRLERAVKAVQQAARQDPELRPSARAATAAWTEAERLCWRLALSGRRIALGEAKKLGGRYMGVADLAQEGTIGLLDAARRFDPERGLRFSTYARWWVRARMIRAIDRKGRPIRLPGSAVQQLRHLNEARSLLPDGATLAEIAAEAGVDEARARLLLGLGSVRSLDDTIEDGTNPRRLSEVIPDDDAAQPDEETIHMEALDRLREAVTRTLPPRQQRILAHRFELDGARARTLRELGGDMGLSRERVRQLEREALRRLRTYGGLRPA